MNPWLISFALLAFGGLLLGGAKAAYDSNRRILMVLLAVTGVISAVAGILWQFAK